MYEELSKNELTVLEDTVHPHITRIFELMEDTRNYYIVMELISGGNLLELILNSERIDDRQCCSIIKQLCLALNYMHN